MGGANLVKGGPNSDYSFTEVRENFIKYLVMYSPNRDIRITAYDKKEEVTVKKSLLEYIMKLWKKKIVFNSINFGI
ncbi:hypothetical protein FDC45_01160 [Clostridium botulinum]|uniref:Uncharacterized protein n=1 Tax=Clostridium botulinum TaxID=1491 RepID=A0A846J0L0_CLOBO|nr:hypothetical protein [Clostridium botulinum]ACA54304.1 hypothetical protein CLK_0159 [Clostridium botulinum A3 str. Loch Maree]NFH64163.1 hypothetical protein [Clostridium botulinum]NFJ07258.1 hypothetical protein [Clostridium botulinum]NFK14230.1 hypothetical protein [Clostridium botulinum]NFM92114.1 hypothetical protein [Clostridium botulinum]